MEAVKTPRSVRLTALLLFLAVFLCYLSLSPGGVSGFGYVGEEMNAGLRLMSIVTAVFKGRPVPEMLWSRHGPIPVLIDLPFLKFGKLFGFAPDFALSLESPLVSAAIVALLFLWLRKICSPLISTFLALVAAFGTMLWPYAYIGLEPKQSFCMLLAGYLGLARGKIRGWPRVVGFALMCGLALTTKATSVVMWPAIAYLLYVQFRDDWRERWPQIATSAAIIVGFCALNVVLRNFYWGPIGGGESNLRAWMIQSKFQIFENVYGLLASPAKGLFVFAPILVAALWAVPRAFRTHRDLVVFASLILVCMMGFLSILIAPYDETWGPRFLHVLNAPLLLCIGAAWPSFNWRAHLPLAALAVMGLMVSFLGAFFYYGVRGKVSDEARQNTMEWLTGDNTWNEIQFNARLFQVWWHGGKAPAYWTATHIWVWAAPPDAPVVKAIDLRPNSDPQGHLFYYWNKERIPVIETYLRFYLFCMIAGLLLLVIATWRALGLGIASLSWKRAVLAAALLGVAGVAAAVVRIPTIRVLRLEVDKTELVAGKDSYNLKVAELPDQVIVIRYSIDGGEEKEFEARLDDKGSVHFDLNEETPKGQYRILAFKTHQDLVWTTSDVVLNVK